MNANAAEIGLILCGDVMLGRGIDQLLPHPSEPTLYEHWRGVTSARTFVDLAQQRNGGIPNERRIDYVWGDALAEFEAAQADVRLVNLETAITAHDRAWPGKAIHYRMHPRNIDVLKCARIDFCALANNHVLDWGYEGLNDTIEALTRAGLHCAGAGRDRSQAGAAAVLPVAGKGRVLVFSLAAVSSGTPQAWAATADRPGVNLIALTENDVGCLQRYVASIKRPGDIVVASIHWGGNFSHQLEPKQQNFAKALIDRAGIDLIHGHSSHHVSAIEVYNGKLILFGCGDLINDYEGIPKSPERQSLRPDLGLIYCIRLNAETGRLASLRMRPMQMRQMRVQRADESDAAWLCAALNRRSAASGARFMAERGVLTIDFG